MVAGLGDAKMAGINVANQLNFAYLVVLWTLCGAGGVYLSQYRGAKDEEGMRLAFRFKTVLALRVWAVFMFLWQTIPDRLVALMTMGNAAQAGSWPTAATTCALCPSCGCPWDSPRPWARASGKRARPARPWRSL
jgi:Na+-driven multidrug efflux pump